MENQLKRTEFGAKIYDDDLPIVAICYDFDRTLSPKEMQEYTLIPKFNMEAKDFWAESNRFAKANGMDKMLSSMYHVIKYAAKNDIKVSEKDFEELGKMVELFDGVETWFERINKFGEKIDVHIEHYIISAGFRELILGNKISKYCEQIYASSFFYDTYGKPVWVKQVINASSKVQYLFRVNKGCLDITDETAVNEYMSADARRIPLGNIIYIGDSETDIPIMRVLTSQGGYSIGVYNPDERGLKTVSKLIKHKRITHFATADYKENSGLDKKIKTIIKNIKGIDEINAINTKQNKLAGFLADCETHFNWVKKLAQDKSIKDTVEIERLLQQFYNDMKQSIEKENIHNTDVKPSLKYLEELMQETLNFVAQNSKK